MSQTEDLSTLSYEEARDQLVEVVRTLEQGGTTLAESLALWERGEELAKVCQRALLVIQSHEQSASRFESLCHVRCQFQRCRIIG